MILNIVQADEIETMIAEINKAKETQNDAGTESAIEEDEAEHRDIVDVDQQDEGRATRGVDQEVINNSTDRQEVNDEERPSFMIYMHENGFIQCWLLEKP